MKVYDWYITPEEYRIAEKNGIKKDTLEKRIRYLAWDKEVAITKPPRKYKRKKWAKVAEKNGINLNTFYSRISTYKWTPEMAATTPLCKGNYKYPKWIKEELKKNGIKYYTFLKRIENGWDFERAYRERTWTRKECVDKARKVQKELNIGAYYEIDNIRTIMSANKNKGERRTV